MRLCEKFLKKSFNVKLSVYFKGRENTRPEIGEALLNRFLEEIKELGQATSDISKGHRSVFVMIASKK